MSEFIFNYDVNFVSHGVGFLEGWFFEGGMDLEPGFLIFPFKMS